MKDREAKLDEVFRRAEDIRRRHEERLTRLLGGATAVLALALIVIIGAFAGRGAQIHGTTLGAFLLGPEAGGYVIVALIAFVLGIAAALLAQRHRRQKSDSNRR